MRRLVLVVSRRIARWGEFPFEREERIRTSLDTDNTQSVNDVDDIADAPASLAADKAVESGGILKWVRENIEIIKVILIVIGGIYAVAEYKGKDYAERVNNSAKIIDKLNSSTEYKALLSLEDFYASPEFADMRAELKSSKLTSADYHKKLFEKTLPDHKDELVKATRGLQSVAICGIQRRCERSTICMYLAVTMEDFRCNFRDSIKALSEDDSNCLVDEIDYFVDNYCREWMKEYLGADNYQGITDNKCLYDKTTKIYTIGSICGNSIIHKYTSHFLDQFVR
jgi:hypothetical protein